MTIQIGDHRLTCIGYADSTEADLLGRFLRQGSRALAETQGEYALVIETDAGDVTVVTSPVGATHYYVLEHDGRLFHGDRVAEILRRSGLAWSWNWQALGDLCQLENLTDNQTLHPAIRRVPPGSILHFTDGRVSLRSVAVLDHIPPAPADPDDAVDALNASVLRLAGDNPYLSLSGGFDSRVILASMLRQGLRPHLITMGREEATDVQVARRMAQRFDLPHRLISLELDDVFAHAPTISSVTNGTKTAWHWHTFLYPLKAEIPAEATFFVGTLGEFARSYYFDRGWLGRFASLAPDVALGRFWRMKLNRHPSFSAEELQHLAPPLAAELVAEGRDRRAARLAGLCRGGFLEGLTRYYFEQRVPNFYANGIRMYRASSAWRSPFHDRRWIEAIWNLPDGWKLGSNWHRHAIARNCPELLTFPEENGFDRRRMLPKAPPLYWTPPMRRARYVSYDLSADWYRDPRMHAFLLEHAGRIDDLVDPELIGRILEAHRSGTDRTRTLAFLLTLIVWKQVIAP
ncbi:MULTISPECIES: asparagine synthase C-terminal domain-containing protein [unclassified Synechococcus]|uniref:asparagine synthase-related protein n=1 Tax=unclassified Synechococcus TaxID=2626047 RepID=UPI001C2476FA|nr:MULTISPECIES: asparagine synthase C-terminal domain-containing protein [unclassified Synechococcus]